ncbi:MAG: methyltransferase domain-containing protein [Ardenticatenaceae bacterium]|nr:methyltransferase domain-containing protein [Ardenticatenaceae bacterium]MCB8991717.1 methyltransferase domain-containing protein [Ardenticatenaceae bacterium]
MTPYTLHYDPLDQQINFEGALRLITEEETARLLRELTAIHDRIEGVLRLNFQRLRYINAAGVRALSLFIDYARRQNALAIQVIASSVVAWSERVLPVLQAIWDRVEFSVYDKNFYKSQGIIEDDGFIPLLRNQTRILWPLEQEVLRRHGLKSGQRVADICCGCGDVPLLISREFAPSFILGVDHSEAAVAYARHLQSEFNIDNAEFQRGDATTLMINDNSFDFVSCRLSLQIFSQPELILKELIRITKPGGQVYVTCEDYDLIVGYPESALIHETYERAAVYGDQMGMDLRSGKKLYSMLAQARLEAIQTDHIMLDTSRADREAFAQVIESWRDFSVYTIGDDLGLDEADQATLLSGYEAQLRAIRSANGFTTWGIVACSGQKPRQ